MTWGINQKLRLEHDFIQNIWSKGLQLTLTDKDFESLLDTLKEAREHIEHADVKIRIQSELLKEYQNKGGQNV